VSAPGVLGRRALNRATLARPLLLARGHQPVPDALEHLVGLQAQAPDAPYVGLWSRLSDFGAEQLAEGASERPAYVRGDSQQDAEPQPSRHDVAKVLQLRPLPAGRRFLET